MVASVPDSEPRTSPRNFSWRAYQFADEPESAATMALAGSRVDSSRNSSIGLTGLASTSASASMVRHQRSTPASMPSRQDRSSFRFRCGISARKVAAASPTRLTSYG